jgi:hypothetical protein
MSTIASQPENCPFRFNSTIELQNITIFDNNGIWRDMFQLTRVLVLSDVVVTF